MEIAVGTLLLGALMSSVLIWAALVAYAVRGRQGSLAPTRSWRIAFLVGGAATLGAAVVVATQYVIGPYPPSGPMRAPKYMVVGLVCVLLFEAAYMLFLVVDAIRTDRRQPTPR